METSYTPEASLDRESFIAENLVEAPWQKRLANNIIDTIIVYGFIFGLAFSVTLLGFNIFGDTDSNSSSFELLSRVYGIILFILYYTFFEYFTGKSIAKFITKTRVINEDGSKPAFGSILGRSLSRIVPFDAFSFLSSNPRGWHDRWSGTMVVNDSDLYNFTNKKHEEEEQY
jgi:uncharacterized RDD family membrane protein YckC